MKRLKNRAPALISLLLAILFPVVGTLAAIPVMLLELETMEGLYLAQLAAELGTLAVFVLLALALGMGYVFRPSHRRLGSALSPALPLILIYTYAGLETAILCMNQPLQSPRGIVWFALCMLAVGLTEELVFRGLITRMLFEKCGKSPLGVWLSVLLSSLLFGLVHLGNALGGAIDLRSVLIQVVGAAALGVCLSAIYLRSGSLWAVALLHGYMDCCSLISSGVFAAESMEALLGSYSAANLLAALGYGALGAFLLRPSKMRTITDPAGQPTQGQILGLMGVVFLLGGLFSAVTVLSL